MYVWDDPVFAHLLVDFDVLRSVGEQQKYKYGSCEPSVSVCQVGKAITKAIPEVFVSTFNP